MSDHRRFRYRIDLAAHRLRPVDPPAGVIVRSPSEADVDLLAELMLEAYRGTIDHDGQGIDEAVQAVGKFMEAETMPACSRLALAGDRAASAVLVARYQGAPFISYVMTAPAHKRTGLGRCLVVDALDRLRSADVPSVWLAITEGNVASEGLFRSVGAYLDPVQAISDGPPPEHGHQR